MSLPNAGAAVVDHAEKDLTLEQREALHKAEHERELGFLDERIAKLEGKVERLKADTSLKDAEKDLARYKQLRKELEQAGPAPVQED